MKRVIIVFLIVICLLMMFCACSEKQTQEKEPDISGVNSGKTSEIEETVPEKAVLSKEEMLAQSTTVNNITLGKEFSSNQVRAKSTYCNHIIQIEGYISIKEDHVSMHIGDEYSWWYIDIFLPEEDIVQLDSSQKVIIVGELDDTIRNSTDSQAKYLCMPTGYLIQDKFNITGTIWGRKTGTNKFNFFEPGHQHGTELTFADGVDTSAYETGKQEIKVYAKVYGYWDSIYVDNTYSDAVPIE